MFNMVIKYELLYKQYKLSPSCGGLKMYQANDIANWFLASVDRESGDNITPLKLQKLTYYAQAWSLALLGEELFSEDFEAWQHGPVVRSVFDYHKGSGWHALSLPIVPVPDFNEDISDLLSNILSTYGKYSAKHLEDLTHSESPWIDARGDLPLEMRSSNVIPKESMKSFYQARYADVNG